MTNTQISDNNVFENSFATFRDWNGYLNNKTSCTATYLTGMRIPSADARYIRLIMFQTTGTICYMFVINISSSPKTITYSGKLSTS